jgi:hypothetical protein
MEPSQGDFRRPNPGRFERGSGEIESMLCHRPRVIQKSAIYTLTRANGAQCDPEIVETSFDIRQLL